MLNQKELDTKILNHIKFRNVDVEMTTTTTVPANGTAWVSVPLPSSGKPIAIVGWYITGGWVYPYFVQLTNTGGSLGIKNTSSSAQNVTITLRYLVVD